MVVVYQAREHSLLGLFDTKNQLIMLAWEEKHFRPFQIALNLEKTGVIRRLHVTLTPAKATNDVGLWTWVDVEKPRASFHVRKTGWLVEMESPDCYQKAIQSGQGFIAQVTFQEEVQNAT